jgi:hypothetical protein
MAIISCPNCTKSISSESINCIHCGFAIQSQSASNPVNDHPPLLKTNHNNETLGSNISSFYSNDFKDILNAFFLNPIDGIRRIFSNNNPDSVKNSMILYGSVFVFYILGSYLILGKISSYMSFGDFIKIGLSPVIFMFIVTILSFIIKSFSKNTNFQEELLTGAICGIPITLNLIMLFIVKIFAENKFRDLFEGDFERIGVFVFLILFYVLLMLINVFQQSLKASGSKDGASWYLSPVSIIIALYFTFLITKNFY